MAGLHWELMLENGNKLVEGEGITWLKLKDKLSENKSKPIRILLYDGDKVLYKSPFDAPGFFFIKKMIARFLAIEKDWHPSVQPQTPSFKKQYFGIGYQKDDLVHITWFEESGKIYENEKRTIEKCGLGYLPAA